MQTESRPAVATSNRGEIQPSPFHLIVQPATNNCDDEMAAVAAVEHWLLSLNADDFPYGAVVTAFNRVGKHVVSTELLDALARTRAALPVGHGPEPGVRLLDQFLDTALDKLDGRYANPTYLGLNLLPLADVDGVVHDLVTIQRQYDRLFLQLITDAARFEIAAADGTTTLLPQMRPDSRTTTKRCRLVLQLAGPAAQRLHLSDELDVVDPIAAARQLWSKVAVELTPAERRILRLTMLPVSLVHDEYQFIRILQSFEATFALMAVQLHAAVQALTAGDAGLARQGILAAESALRDAAPLFSLVATMQLEAFQTFREFTEGASAIQSRNYKLVESLCRQPDASRLDSAAYLSVPEARQRVLAGQLTLDDAFTAARREGRLSPYDIEDLERAMQRFAATLLKWRRTHHRIAVRMLGESTGTGYTAGAAYLKSVQEIPVFSSLPMADAVGEAIERQAGSHEEIARVQTASPHGAHRRCPFSGRAAS